MSGLTALMFVVWMFFIIAFIRIPILSDKFLGTDRATGESWPWIVRLLGGASYFIAVGIVFFYIGWLVWKIGWLMLLPVKYLWSLLP